MKVNYLETMTIDDNYVSSEYIIAIESHLNYLKNTSTMKAVSKQQTFKYEGDFYGLLLELNIPANYFYVTMRVNDLVNSTDYKGNSELLFVPNFSEIDKIVSILETKKD